jgi:hypothetical protein
MVYTNAHCSAYKEYALFSLSKKCEFVLMKRGTTA